MKNFLILTVVFFLNSIVYGQNTTDFGSNLALVIREMSQQVVDSKKVDEILLQMGPKDKPVTVLEVDYSIYPGFEGVKTYFTQYKAGEDQRLTADVLAKDGQQKYYSIDLITDVSYHYNEQGTAIYEQPDNAYNVDLSVFDSFCSRPMTYKNGKTDTGDSVLKSCVYVNESSKRQVFFWVVCALPINTKGGNTIKQIKIQSTELY